MFFSSSPVNQPVPHLGNILKEIVDTVKEEEMDEYKRDFSMTEEEKKYLEYCPQKQRILSLLKRLHREKPIEELIQFEINKNENVLYEENKQMTVKEIKEILAKDIYSSAYHTFSLEFLEKKFSEEEEKTDNDFKAFNSNKEEVYYPDNEFVYNLCSGLINLSEINDLRDNK